MREELKSVYLDQNGRIVYKSSCDKLYHYEELTGHLKRTADKWNGISVNHSEQVKSNPELFDNLTATINHLNDLLHLRNEEISELKEELYGI